MINIGIRANLRIARLINSTGPEVNDHINLQWP
jgi:hypothetical protein